MKFLLDQYNSYVDRLNGERQPSRLPLNHITDLSVSSADIWSQFVQWYTADNRDCGLNADWCVSAWHIGPSSVPNKNNGDFYIVDDEDGTYGIVQRFHRDDDNDEINEIVHDIGDREWILQWGYDSFSISPDNIGGTQ